MSQKIKEYAMEQGMILDHELQYYEKPEWNGEVRPLTKTERLEREKQLLEPVF